MPSSVSYLTLTAQNLDGTPVLNALISAYRFQSQDTGEAGQTPLTTQTDLFGMAGIALPRLTNGEATYRIVMPDRRNFTVTVPLNGDDDFLPLGTIDRLPDPVKADELDITALVQRKLRVLQQTGSTAIGAVKFTSNPTNNQTKIINGIAFTFKTTPAGTHHVQIGATLAITLANFTNVLNTNAAGDPEIALAGYSASGDTLYTTYGRVGALTEAFTLDGGSAAFTLPFGSDGLVGGVDPIGAKKTVHTDSAEPEINLDTTDILSIVRDGGGVDLNLPSYSGISDKTFIIRIKADDVYGIHFNGGAYRAIGVTLPTDTVGGRWIYMAMVYNVADQIIDVLSVQTQA